MLFNILVSAYIVKGFTFGLQRYKKNQTFNFYRKNVNFMKIYIGEMFCTRSPDKIQIDRKFNPFIFIYLR